MAQITKSGPTNKPAHDLRSLYKRQFEPSLDREGKARTVSSGTCRIPL